MKNCSLKRFPIHTCNLYHGNIQHKSSIVFGKITCKHPELGYRLKAQFNAIDRYQLEIATSIILFMAT